MIFRGLNLIWYVVRAILDDIEILYIFNLVFEVNLIDEDLLVKYCIWCSF